MRRCHAVFDDLGGRGFVVHGNVLRSIMIII
jgi:hypothetical protein